MCCGHESHRSGRHWGLHHGAFCACGGPFHFGRRFWTKKERASWLEQYLEALREEVNAVEERIAELKEEK